ncbi:glucose-1-phosphate thymidylyltransferase RfbA [Phycisphaera mikurensis]|uniref:Glucose-1-phosphate thymidylyltransferase n=1 Tax=Phycisphaera mikurensis (strain NBRC 102666 / KCTC 22515 / FYK2301M01) TaxID=1142394 RepID=I0IBF4_PHYMF|nr:glucose-1-phosphate thymidylyltransferase RfbA [Phycisphaera mikurensis]MBB6442875.1 glucose-1-phosphate thymidylyltransferase [Phycisphaera mikurensis]BAM02592.1 glucose-1-phosphate thymidylyltransferase [Phycisphaera mikurensis NBRC 102666]
MKGILLAGGHGTRLAPLTGAISKQLLPVYNKPMIYYPLSVLMLAGVREVMVISTPTHLPLFGQVLGDGSAWGMRFHFVEQAEPRGLAQAFTLDPGFHGTEPACLILGDNLIYGSGLARTLASAAAAARRPGGGAAIFGYPVRDPRAYGVVEVDGGGRAVSLEEKPARPRGHLAVPGLYFYDGSAGERAAALAPSPRGELEITDLNRTYLDDGLLSVERWGRGMAWLDAGTHESLLEAQNFVRTVEQRQGTMIGCPEEIALRSGWIGADDVLRVADAMGDNRYASYLRWVAGPRDGPAEAWA